MKKAGQFVRLIQNELIKTFFQKKTIVFICILILTVVANGIIDLKNDQGNLWKSKTEQQISSLKQTISEEKSKNNLSDIDKEMLKSEQDNLRLMEYRLNHNMPDNAKTPLRFAYESNGLVFLIVLFMAVFSANLIANEYTGGTIRQILVKPIKRWKIFLAKYASAIIVCLLLCIILYSVAVIIGFLFFGHNSMSINDVVLLNGNLVERNMLSFVVLSTLSDVFSIIVTCSITFLMATIVKSGALAIVTTLGVYFAGLIGGSFISSSPIYRYILTTNLTLSKYLPGEQLPFQGATFAFSLTVCLTYMVAFLVIGTLIFEKRDIY